MDCACCDYARGTAAGTGLGGAGHPASHGCLRFLESEPAPTNLGTAATWMPCGRGTRRRSYRPAPLPRLRYGHRRRQHDRERGGRSCPGPQRKGDADEDEDRPRVGRVPDPAVRTVGDQPMPGFDLHGPREEPAELDDGPFPECQCRDDQDKARVLDRRRRDRQARAPGKDCGGYGDDPRDADQEIGPPVVLVRTIWATAAHSHPVRHCVVDDESADHHDRQHGGVVPIGEPVVGVLEHRHSLRLADGSCRGGSRRWAFHGTSSVDDRLRPSARPAWLGRASCGRPPQPRGVAACVAPITCGNEPCGRLTCPLMGPRRSQR